MNAESLRFLEIEHKFLVASDYDETPLLEKLHARKPEKSYKTDVLDTYFLSEAIPGGVFRHRIDARLQQLTFKDIGGDNEARTEVNLGLDLECGNQKEAVEAFLRPLHVLWSGTLSKSVQVFYFQDVEVVFYRAAFGDKSQACIEIEARQANSLREAHDALERWEHYLGLDAVNRCKASVLELLIVPQLPPSLCGRFQNLQR